MIHDTRKRSVAKSLTWRVCATVTTAVLVYIFTKSFKFALTIGFFEIIIKMMVYYVHERLWSHTEWGMK